LREGLRVMRIGVNYLVAVRLLSRGDGGGQQAERQKCATTRLGT
jgi:hypothetical protein